MDAARRTYLDKNKEQLKEYSKEYKKANKDKVNAYDRAYYEKNKERISKKRQVFSEANRDRLNSDARARKLKNPKDAMFSAAKLRAKAKDIEFNITKNDFSISKLCPVLDIPMFPGKGKLSDNSPTLDRKDNSKGYIKGNILVISHRANSIKRDATIDELEKIIDYMKS